MYMHVASKGSRGITGIPSHAVCTHSHTDLYFLIQWCDTEDVMYDAIPARDITPSGKGKDVLDLHPGDECKASFANALYPAEVVAVGEFLPN